MKSAEFLAEVGVGALGADARVGGSGPGELDGVDDGPLGRGRLRAGGGAEGRGGDGALRVAGDAGLRLRGDEEVAARLHLFGDLEGQVARGAGLLRRVEVALAAAGRSDGCGCGGEGYSGNANQGEADGVGGQGVNASKSPKWRYLGLSWRLLGRPQPGASSVPPATTGWHSGTLERWNGH